MPSQEFSGYSPLKMRKERKVADARRVVVITLFIDSFNLNFSVILLYPLCHAYRQMDDCGWAGQALGRFTKI